MKPFREQVMELLDGTTSTSSGSSRFKKRTPRRPKQNTPPWKSKLIDALACLVAEHRLRIDLMGEICRTFFCAEMVDCFVKLPPCKQMEQLKILVGDCKQYCVILANVYDDDDRFSSFICMGQSLTGITVFGLFIYFVQVLDHSPVRSKTSTGPLSLIKESF